MEISASAVKELREKTNAGMMDCKKALSEAQGDMEKALEILRKKGVALATKKAGRATNEGVIDSYIHPGNKVGVMVEVNCETDFVARNEIFQRFVKDIMLQIASLNPLYLSKDHVPAEIIAKEKDIAGAQITGKPANVVEKIVEGKISKYCEQVCLLEQPFIKDDKIKINDLLKAKIAELGENISIKRFVRFQLGEEA